MENKKIPIVIGVTGHRDLREENIAEIRKLVRQELNNLVTKYVNSEFVMLNSLAKGGDALCAEVALELGIKLVCPLPFEIPEYKKDFEGEDLAEFEYLLSKAYESFVVPQIEEKIEGRDYYYRQAGIYVAENCHLLLALWDEGSARKNGCGTAEAVSFMLEGIDIKSYKSDDAAVLHISSPRISNNKELSVTSNLIENKKGSLEEILTKTDNFNKESASLKEIKTYPLLKDIKIDDSKIRSLESIYGISDYLSLTKQKSYLNVLKVMSVFAVLLVLLFLLNDVTLSKIYLIGFGICLFIYAVIFKIASDADKHGLYLEYRALSESMRVQYYLSLLGISKNVYEYYTWGQKTDFAWIKKAINALLIGEKTKEKIDDDIIRKYWIDDQLSYHKYALENDNKRYKSMNGINDAMLKMTCFAYIFILVFELFFTTLIDYTIFIFELRTWLSIALGCISAITLFVSSFYGKLSLSRKIEDHKKMIALFENILYAYDKFPEDRKEIFMNLAKEEIIENGNWVSYSKENKPDFNL